MNDLYNQLLSHLRGIWNRRWLVIALAWLVCGVGWVTVANLPDRYESSARVYVDMDTMLGPLMKGMAVEMNVAQQMDIMRRTLMSRPNIEKIILMTDLDLGVRSAEAREQLIDSLGDRITIAQQGRNLFRIAFSATDPGLARRVVQAVMQTFVEGNLGASRQDMETTQRFLEGQISDYERQLEEAEQRLARFKRENMGALPGGGNYYAHMQEVRRQLADIQAQTNEAMTVRDEYRSQLSQIPQFLEVAADPGFIPAGPRGPASDLHIRILETQQVVDSLLSRYTEKHPDVQAAMRQLEALQKELGLEQAALGPPGSGMELVNAGGGPEGAPPPPKKNLVPNPIYEQIKLQLVQQEGALAALKSRAALAQSEVEKWAGMAQMVPEVEAQLARLNRDYDIIKRGYEQLRQRQEAANLARDLELKAQKVQFRIIDPPTLPVEPSGPNRPLLLATVLGAGLAVGVAFAFLLDQINTTFSSVHRLRDTFTLPVLGRISAVVSKRERRQRLRETLGFAVVCLMLAAAYGGLVGLERFELPGVFSKIKDLLII